ncbi:MAG: hypothetical protein L6R42_004705, partial [Xanthoria sp. 1 TBL-2021]
FGSASTDAIREDLTRKYAHALQGSELRNSEDVYLKVVDHEEDAKISEGTMIA